MTLATFSITRVSQALTNNVDDILNSCASNLFAMRMLRAKGLSNELLYIIFKATILSKLTYASQFWWGFLTASEIERLEAFLRRASRCSFYDGSSTFSDLAKGADCKLFNSIVNNNEHVLFPLLPPVKNNSSYRLRPRPHNFTLPGKRSSLAAKN